MHLSDAGLATEAPQHLLEAVRLERDARHDRAVSVRGEDERSWLRATHLQVGCEPPATGAREEDEVLLVALAEADAQAPRLKVGGR